MKKLLFTLAIFISVLTSAQELQWPNTRMMLNALNTKISTSELTDSLNARYGTFTNFSVPIGTVHYIADIADGTNITTRLTDTIAACGANDIIVLPAGKFVITGEIAVTEKDISIIGQGADSTTGTMLYRNAAASNYFFKFYDWQYYQSDRSVNKIFVSNIYFKARPSVLYGGAYNDSDYGVWFLHINSFFSDNVVQYAGIEQCTFSHADSIPSFWGLAFDNDFLDGYRSELANYGYGVGIGGKADNWLSVPEFGTNKFVFIEDNTFRRMRHGFISNQNGKGVVRYNTFQDCWAGAPIDGHGAGEYGATYSVRAVEVYNNTIDTDIDEDGVAINGSTAAAKFPLTAIQPRGGEWVIYNNTISAYESGVRAFLEETTPGTYPTNYPSVYQTGYTSGLVYGATDTRYKADHGDGDAFIWDNTITKSRSEHYRYLISAASGDWLKFGRDIDTIAKPGYAAFTYPHPYRNFYYAFIDSLRASDTNYGGNLSTVTASSLSSSGVTLNWTNVLCEDGYRIYISTDNVTFTLNSTTAKNVVTKAVQG